MTTGAILLLALALLGCQQIRGEGGPLQGENGTGDGKAMQRVGASGARTVWLHDGETRAFSFEPEESGSYNVFVRYSNDNFGPTETVTVNLDGSTVGQFSAEDTGSEGHGWVEFRISPLLGLVSLSSGKHKITVVISGGDGYGIEIDEVILDRIT